MIAYLNKKLHTPFWLFILLVVVLVLRIPSFFEPYSYGDEMIYLALGEAIRQGISLYSEIHDNKPPLLYIMAAIAGNLFWFKAILAIWHLVTVYIFWKLSKVFFSKNTRAQQVSTILFAIFTTIPLLEGNIVNAELFMIGPTFLAFYLLLTRKLTFNILFVSGILFSISSLFKIPAIFEVPAIILYWFLEEKNLNKNKTLEIIRRSLIVAAGVLLPILLSFAYYALAGAFREYLIAAYLQNFGYLSSFRPGDIQKPFLVKNGPLLTRGAIVLIGFAVLYFFRNKLSLRFKFATIWLLLTLFAVTLSERPYPHYLIQSVAPLSILAAIFVTAKNMEQIYTIIPFALAAFVPVYFNFWHYKSLPYYVRFVNLTVGNLTREEYLSTFGSQVPRNYELSEFIVSATQYREKIFVWGDGVPVYALSKRLPPIKYVADYHINDFSSKEETISKLENDLPSYIIVQPGAESFNELDWLLLNNYGFVKEVDGAKIWKLLSPSVRNLLSY